MHAVFAATSGGGKTSAFEHLMLAAALQGHGVLYIDPHRRSARRIIGALGPVEDRVIYLDPQAEQPILFNPFAGVSALDVGLVAADFLDVIGPLLGTEGLRRLEYVLLHGIAGLAVLGLPLAVLPELYADSPKGEVLRAAITHNALDEPLVRFWRDEFPVLARQPSIFTPIHNRFSGLFMNRKTRAIFGQVKSAIDIPHIMRTARIVILPLPEGWEAGRIQAGLLLGQVKHCAMRRPEGEPRFFVFCDEISRLAGSPLHQLLDQTTKGGVTLVMAHQNTSQIPSDLAKTIQGIDTIVLRCNDDDAKHYASLLRNKVNPETLANQRVGAAYARIGTDVCNFQFPPPIPSDPIVAARIIAASEARYYAPPTTREPEELTATGLAARLIDTDI
jgi:hypothetical protein